MTWLSGTEEEFYPIVEWQTAVVAPAALLNPAKHRAEVLAYPLHLHNHESLTVFTIAITTAFIPEENHGLSIS